MARINIEECWWTDPRRSKLIKILGTEEMADAVAIKAWRLAQEHWKHNRRRVPFHIFQVLEKADALLESGLAVKEEDGSFVYVRGSSDYLDWVREKREQASDAGKKSAEIRKKKNGTAQPPGGKGSKKPKKSERKPNDDGTESNGTEPSDSGSISVSVSSSDSSSAEKEEFTNVNSQLTAEKSKAQFFIAGYCERFRKKYGSNPEIQGKDAGIAGRVSKGLSEEKINLYLDGYFSLPDAWLSKTKHPISAFETKLNEVVVFVMTGKFITNRQVQQADDMATNMALLHKERNKGAK